MNENSQLATREPSIPQILAAAVQGGITKENVEVVKELVAMQKQMRDEEAQRDFAAAFAKLQAECAPVKASKAVPGNDGTIRYCYAPYEAIMKEVAPLLKTHGFAVTFDTDIVEGRVIATCTLMHTSGHSKSNKFAARIGSGPPKASEAQSDGAATTYAKRFALCAALNIVVEGIDNDAKGQDLEPITEQESVELQEWCEQTGADKAKFLKFAGVSKFADIPRSKLPELKEILRRRKDKASA